MGYAITVLPPDAAPDPTTQRDRKAVEWALRAVQTTWPEYDTLTENVGDLILHGNRSPAVIRYGTDGLTVTVGESRPTDFATDVAHAYEVAWFLAEGLGWQARDAAADHTLTGPAVPAAVTSRHPATEPRVGLRWRWRRSHWY